jgi:hypothetical protein
MTLDDFQASRSANQPPDKLNPALAGLWRDGKAIGLQGKDADGSWVHAYLHRKEGDEVNADISVVVQNYRHAE